MLNCGKNYRLGTRILKAAFVLALVLSWSMSLNRMGVWSWGRTLYPITSIQPEYGTAALSEPFPSEILTRGIEIRLIEDGVPFPKYSDVTTETVRTLGAGRFAVWEDGTVLFSASDSTSPAANGRTYTLSLPKFFPKRAVKTCFRLTLALTLLIFAAEVPALWRRRAEFRLTLRENRWLILGCVAVVIPFFVLSWKLILPRDLWGDELYTLQNYVLNEDPLYPATVYDYPNNHVLFNLVLGVVARSLRITDFSAAVRETTLLRIGLFWVPALTFLFMGLSARRFGKRPAFTAVLLLAVCLPFYAWSLQLRGYGLSMMLLSALIYAILRQRAAPSHAAEIAIVGLTAALIYVIPFNAALLSGLGVAALWNALRLKLFPNPGHYHGFEPWFRGKDSVRKKPRLNPDVRLCIALLLGVGLGVICCLPIWRDLLAVYLPGGVHQPKAHGGQGRIAFPLELLRTFAVSFIADRVELAIVFALALVVMIALRRELGRTFGYFRDSLAWTLILLVIFCAATGYRMGTRMLLPLVPLILLLAGVLLAKALDQIRSNRWRVICLTLLTLLTLAQSIRQAVRYAAEPVTTETTLDNLAHPPFLSDSRNASEVLAYLRETQRDFTPILYPLSGDMYESELCAGYNLPCYPDHYGPEGQIVLYTGGPYRMVQATIQGETNPVIERKPYRDECVADEEFARRFAPNSMFTLYNCRMGN